jgi:hypothetical protein
METGPFRRETMPIRPITTPSPEPPASNRSAEDPQKPGQPTRPGPPVEPESSREKAKGPQAPEHYTATHEPGETDERPDDTGRRDGEKGAL